MNTAEGMSTAEPEEKPKRRCRWLKALGIACGLVGLVIVLTWWTMIRMPGASYRGELPAADDRLMALENELRADVTHLAVDIGARNVKNRPQQLAQAADYIESQFTTAGYTARRQGFDVSGRNCVNIEVEILGSTRPKEIVIVGGHYDTDTGSGTPGANDNASGVAATLALARRFSTLKPERTIRFVAFVNEEGPYFRTEQMGSWVNAKLCRQRDENITAMLSLETIGYYNDSPGSQKYPPPVAMLYPATGNFIGIIGNLASRDLVRCVVGTFRRSESFPSEGAILPESIRGISLSDHWAFWREGYPAVMITDTAKFRYPYFHTREDMPDKLDFNRMARVVRGLEYVVAELAGVKK